VLRTVWQELEMAWLQADGAGIALGISALFLVAAVVMHRVIRKVLMTPTPPDLPTDGAKALTPVTQQERGHV